MEETIKRIKMEGEFKHCPACGYKDGFHSMFRQEGEITRWLFVCPACRAVFDIGFTV